MKNKLTVWKDSNVKPKEFSLKLEENGDYVVLKAVDSETGEHIANLMFFKSDGSVTTSPSAEKVLQDTGYDPIFIYDDNGKILVNY